MMRTLACLVALALGACSTMPDVGGAYSAYAISLRNAADWAESDHGPHASHVGGTIKAMADFNDSPAMTKAVDHAEAYLVCKAPTPHVIPDYPCDEFDLSAKAMTPVVKQLYRGAFVLRQGVFSIKDMHGQDTTVRKGQRHDH